MSSVQEVKVEIIVNLLSSLCANTFPPLVLTFYLQLKAAQLINTGNLERNYLDLSLNRSTLYKPDCSQIYSVINLRLYVHPLPSKLRTSLGIPDLVKK